MTISVHELRGIAPGQRPTRGSQATAPQGGSKLQKTFSVALRIVAALVIAFWLTLFIGSIVSDAIESRPRAARESSWAENHAARPRQASREGSFGGLAAWFPGWFEFRAPDETTKTVGIIGLGSGPLRLDFNGGERTGGAAAHGLPDTPDFTLRIDSAQAAPAIAAGRPVGPGPAQDDPGADAAADSALAAAQADFRKVDEASRLVHALAARDPSRAARNGYERRLALVADLRRNALRERTTLNTKEDRFAGADIADAAGNSITTCFATVSGLVSAVVARKAVSVHPSIPAWVVVGVAPGLRTASNEARKRVTAEVDMCLAPLKQAGTAMLHVEPAPDERLLTRLKRTTGALVWRK